MTHEELRERLLDLAYGELSRGDARVLEEHAASCDACRTELGRIRETRRLMSALPEEPAPAEGERVLIAAARDAASRRAARRIVPQWLWRGSLVAASLAAIAAVSYRVASMRPRSPGREDPNALMGEAPYARAPQPAPALPERPAPETASPREPRAGAGAVDTAPHRAAPARERREHEKKGDGPRRGIDDDVPPGQDAPAAAAETRTLGALPAVPRGTGEVERPAIAESMRAAPTAPAPQPQAPSRSAKAAPPSASRAPERWPEGVAGSSGPEAATRRDGSGGRTRTYVEERTFPGCRQELWRRVERDADGRVVSYAWEELVGTRRLRFEAIYGVDGSVVRKQALDVATSTPDRSVKFSVPPRSSVDIDAPPRCSLPPEQ